MIEWKLSEKDRKIVGLLKTMDSRYLDDAMNGRFCFNLPGNFRNDDGLKKGQIDVHEGMNIHKLTDLVISELTIEEDGSEKYGPVMPFASEATGYFGNPISDKTALCCFRSVTNDDFEFRDDKIFLKLRDDIVDRIKAEMGHDAFIFIPSIPYLVSRFETAGECVFGKSVHYGYPDKEFEEFLDTCTFPQKSLFQKSKEYEWQKEFRFITTKNSDEKGHVFINVGSLITSALGGPIDGLSEGVRCGHVVKKVSQA